MAKLNFKKLEGKWVDYLGMRLLVRPFPASEYPFTVNTAEMKSGDYFWVITKACLIGWEQVDDEEGNPIKFSEKHKKMLYDYVEGLGYFINSESEKMLQEFNADLKN